MELRELLPETNLTEEIEQSSSLSFMEANTIAIPLEEIKSNHIIPVFVKDNETTISHVEFIETMYEVAKEHFNGEAILKPSVRVSHPIKGRIPEARNKAAKELLDHEKTLYYERMCFCMEIPHIRRTINGNDIALVVGGVKAYSEDNLYNKKGAIEHFKIFIGFQNKVCLNLKIFTDGLKSDVRVANTNDLYNAIFQLLKEFQTDRQLAEMEQLALLYLSPTQFAQMIGRAKLYQHLPAEEKKLLPTLMFGDYQLSAVTDGYYNSQSFSRDGKGNISLWNTYNLLTGANKSSYIDKFLDRAENASLFIGDIRNALAHNTPCWFLE
ncbi:MAG: DUF3871 family protein [Bacteroidetes bacterium]|nr:DUF3871 family protein [Bacteroidota bacterium]